MKRAMVLSLLAAVIISGSAWADVNFVPGNEGDGTYVPRAERYAAREAAKSGEPGFWDKEWERSGLKSKFSKVDGKSLNPFVGLGDFLKEKEEAYKAKKGY